MNDECVEIIKEVLESKKQFKKFNTTSKYCKQNRFNIIVCGDKYYESNNFDVVRDAFSVEANNIVNVNKLAKM